MEGQSIILISVSTLFGLLRWIALFALIGITFYLIKKTGKTNKSWRATAALVVTIIAMPFLILEIVPNKQSEPTVPKTTPVEPTPTPEPTPEPIPEPTPDPEPEPTPTPDNPVTPSKPSKKPSEAPKTPDTPDTPVAPETPDEPKEPDEPEKVTYHLVLENADIISDDKSGSYAEGDSITIRAKAKAGYTFKRWLSGDENINNKTENPLSFEMPNGLLLINAEYEANTNTKYTVKHYVMNVAGNYDLDKTDNLTGTTDTEVTPELRDYEGCKKPATQTKKIAGDGSMVIEYYYERNKVQFTLNQAAHGSVASTIESGEYYYGREITLTANPDTGYNFVKWSNNQTDNPYTITLTDTTNIAPIFEAKDNIQYVVNHNKMDLSGHYQFFEKDEYHNGVTDADTTAPTKSYEGFYTPTAITKPIAGDGSTVYEYNYARKQIQFTLNQATHGTASSTVDNGEYYYEREITISAAPDKGYHFVKWSDDTTDNPYTITLTSATEIQPVYAANSYSIAYDKNSNEATGADVTAQTGIVYDTSVKLNKNTYSRTGWRFLGWAKDATATTAEYTDEQEGVLNLSATDGATVTLYAVWEEKFPIVWQQAGDCIFGGNDGTISGDCGEYNGQKFINTGIKPFSSEHHNEDFDIYFELEGFENTQSDSNQTTFLSIKEATALNNGAPGVVVRGASTNKNIEYKSTTDGKATPSISYPKTGIQKIRVIRKDGVIYYTVNGKNLWFELDNRGNSYQEFNSDVWFGAGEKIIDNVLSPQRVFTGTMRNMYIRMGEMDDFETYTITFDAAGGTLSKNTGTIKRGDAIESLPTPTRDNYLFDGWFVKGSNPQQDVADGVVPEGDVTYKGSWTKDVSQATIADEDIHMAVGNTNTIQITNASSVEPVTYRSKSTSIASVDEDGVITAKKRGETQIVITGTRSNKTRTINVTIAEYMTVTFDANGGTTSSASATVEYGHTLADSDIPTATRATYVHDGWWNGNEEVSTETPITSNITYTAHWLKDVSHLEIANETIEFITGDSPIAIQLSNTNNMEAYTFSSNAEAIATVNESGEVTPVTAGTAKIIIKGAKSEVERYVNITVSDPAPTTYTVNFDKNYSTKNRIITIQAPINQAIGNLIPDAERADYVFDGWFTEKKGGTEITSETVIDSEKTYYAHWHFDTMPIVWQHEGACVFTAASDGSAGNVSGDECQDYATSKTGLGYIDTGIQLYTDENIDKDYEIYFEIDEYDPNNQTASSDSDNKQQTFVNAKDPKNSAGLIIRRSTNDIEFNTNIGGGTTNNVQSFKKTYAYGNVKKARIKRVGGAILVNYYNGSQWMANDYEVHNIGPGDAYHFVITTWFGAYPNKDTSGATSANGNYLPKANRFLTGTLSHMYIKLERDASEAPYESDDTVYEHNVASEAANEYLTNVQSWNTGRENFLTKLKENFDGNSCSLTTNNIDVDSKFDYKYASGGTNDCDKSVPYITPINSALKVFVVDENTKTKQGEVAYTKSENGALYNLIPGTTYRWEKADDENVYGYVKAKSTNNRRFITAGPTRNIRDLGGIPTVDGKTIKYGKLMRGENFDSKPDTVTDLTNLGFNTEYDLRESNSPTSARLETYKRDQVIHYNFAYHEGDETNTSSNYYMTRKAISDIMTDVAGGKKVYFHCSAGADRAGTVAYLLEGLLGVDDETRYEDYELTTLSGRSDRNRYYEKKGDNTYKFTYMMTYMSTKEQILEWFFAGTTNQSADEDLVEAFKTAVLED